MEVIRLSSELLPHRYPPPAASSAADSDNGGEMPVGRTMDMDFTVSKKYINKNLFFRILTISYQYLIFFADL